MVSLRDIKIGLANLWYWLPFVWRDRDWSWCYICVILRAKLRKHRQHLQSDRVMPYVGLERDIKNIRLAERLLKRIEQEEYFEQLDIEWVEGGVFGKDIAGCHTLGWAGAKNWMEYEDYMKNQDLELLCKILKKHLFCWWD